MDGIFKNNDKPRIVGECRQCGACCYFSYWVRVKDPVDFEYYMRYAMRFFNKIELTRQTDTVGLITIHDIPCRHLDVSDNHCKAHGTPDKPDDCCKYPFHWPADVFDKVRVKTCGYTVK